MSRKVLPLVTEASSPTVTDDKDSGFIVGMLWLNTATGTMYRCNGVAVGAAVWDALGGGGGGSVDTVVAGDGITVDDTDPANPIVNATAIVESVVAGDGIDVDDTDPANPIVSSTATGIVESIVAGTNVTVDSTDPANPIVSASGGGGSLRGEWLRFEITLARIQALGPTVAPPPTTLMLETSPGVPFVLQTNEFIRGVFCNTSQIIYATNLQASMQGFGYLSPSYTDLMPSAWGGSGTTYRENPGVATMPSSTKNIRVNIALGGSFAAFSGFSDLTTGGPWVFMVERITQAP